MKKTNDLISIIIPIYNRQELIEECIASVFAQSYQNFEIIIVDDGSSDNTYKICHSLAEADPRIKLFAMDHGGVSAARNKALDVATGEFIFFLDSDDVIHPSLLEALVTGMKKNDANIGATDVARATADTWYKVENKLKERDAIGEVIFLS